MGKNLRMVGDTLRKSYVSSGSLGRKKEENNTRIFKSRKSKVDESKKTRQIRNKLSGYKLRTVTEFSQVF